MIKRKRTFLLLCLLFLAGYSYAQDPLQQQIVPVEEHLFYLLNGTEIPEDAYIQDVNNKLDEFVGTWMGTHAGKTFEFYIEKSLLFEENYQQDLLTIRYRILDTGGMVLVDTTTLPDNDPLIIEGLYFHQNGTTYWLDYIGSEAACGESGDLFITTSNNGNQLTAYFVSGSGMINTAQCPQGAAEWDFPLEEHILLTKQ